VRPSPGGRPGPGPRRRGFEVEAPPETRLAQALDAQHRLPARSEAASPFTVATLSSRGGLRHFEISSTLGSRAVSNPHQLAVPEHRDRSDTA